MGATAILLMCVCVCLSVCESVCVCLSWCLLIALCDVSNQFIVTPQLKANHRQLHSDLTILRTHPFLLYLPLPLPCPPTPPLLPPSLPAIVLGP